MSNSNTMNKKLKIKTSATHIERMRIKTPYLSNINSQYVGSKSLPRTRKDNPCGSK
jgi:hypothetical protein